MSEDSKTNIRYLLFSLAGEAFAMPLLKVKEVIAMTEFTPVPNTPAHFKGIMNLRGQVFSVIDLRQKLRMKSDHKSETSIIILDVAQISLGVVVDSIDSVLAVEPADIQPRPDIESQVNADYITGVVRRDKQLVLLLDIESTLNIADLQSLKQAQLHQAA